MPPTLNSCGGLAGRLSLRIAGSRRLFLALLAGIHLFARPAPACGADSITFAVQWSPDLDNTSATICTSPPGPVAANGGPAIAVRMLWDADLQPDGFLTESNLMAVTIEDTNQAPKRATFHFDASPFSYLSERHGGVCAEPLVDGYFSCNWDGVTDVSPADRAGGQAPAGVYTFRFRAKPPGFPGDQAPSDFVNITDLRFKLAAFDAASRLARFYLRYSFTAQNNYLQDNPPCSAGWVDLYRWPSGEMLAPVPLSGDDLKPGTRTRWLFVTIPEGVEPAELFPVLEMVDSHALVRKARFARRVLPRAAQAGELPLAHNFDYVYPDVSSDDYAGLARQKQAALLDGTAYVAYDATNRPASELMAALQKDAVFHFFGHGGGPTVAGNRQSYALAWNGTARSYVVQKQGMADVLCQMFGPELEVHVLDALPAGALSKLLLAVFCGCFTANDFPEYGSPTRGVVEKGARAALGFTQTIYSPYAQRWNEFFWQYACQGWTDSDGVLRAVGFATASEEALKKMEAEYRALDPGFKELATGLRSVKIFPAGANFRIFPAGGWDSRNDHPEGQ